MDLDGLNKIAIEAKQLESVASSLRRKSELLARYRKGSAPLLDVIRDASESRPCDDRPTETALHRALANVREEVIRLAELDLEIQARPLSNRARVLRALVAAFLVEDPEIKEPS